MPEKRAAPSKNEKEKNKELKVGQIVSSAKDNYSIEERLGAGGFGAVYKVHSVNDFDKKFAMKIEYPNPEIFMNRLKVEIVVFAEIAKSKTTNKSHFFTMRDKGKTPHFKYMVLDLIGHSLDRIYYRMLGEKMSLSTTIKIGRQTLEAIEALHECGWVHRDIKPANFAIGRPPKDSTIYMLDFGIAKQYLDGKGKHIVPRKHVPFLGTKQYASRNCHLEREMSRMDDFEVWCYMMLLLFGSLPWFHYENGRETYEYKTKLFASPEKYWASKEIVMPKKFVDIIKLVDKMSFSDAGDVKTINRILDEIVKDEKVDESLPFDWIGKTMPEKAPPVEQKKKKEENEEMDKDGDHGNRKKKQMSKERIKKNLEEKRDTIESKLIEVIELSRDMDESDSKKEIRANRRARDRPSRDERRRRRRKKTEADEEEQDANEDFISMEEEDDQPRRRRNRRKTLKSVADDEPRPRKKRDRRRNSRDDGEDNRRSRGQAGRKKTARQGAKSYGEGGSKLEKYGRKKKSRAREEEEFAKMPADSPMGKSGRGTKKKDPDYICLRTAEDLEHEEDAKDKENSEKRSGYSAPPEKEPKSALSYLNGKDVIEKKDGKDGPPMRSKSTDSR